MLNCLEQVGFILPSTGQMYGNLSKKLEWLARALQTELSDDKLKGELEIRVHNNLFSSIGYYSDSVDNSLIWMYFSDHKDGIEYPALHVINQDLIKDADDHFDNLWLRSAGDGVLLKINKKKGIINNISKILRQDEARKNLKVNVKVDDATSNSIPNQNKPVTPDDVDGNST